MDSAQALGIAIAAFVAFSDPHGCAVAQAPAQVEAIGRRALQSAMDEWSRRMDSDIQLVRAEANQERHRAVPDAAIHARGARL